ncbi:MAG: dephospho-CoA kinase [Rhizobiales bacterium]|nr:dephospho-CoA kinase [Hyphomicrobiales bacterium]
MIVAGLTGSIAMGKSETAKMFRTLGIPVFDSDAEVHRQYEKGGAAVEAVARLFPEAVVEGAVNRGILSKRVLGNPQALKQLEAAIHPFVRKSQDAFLEQCRTSGHRLAVLDIPLLFETGREMEVDAVVVVSAPAGVQRERVLKRPGMTAEKLARILARQMPDAEKRAKADYVVDTSKDLDIAAAQVSDIVADLLKKDAKRQP